MATALRSVRLFETRLQVVLTRDEQLGIESPPSRWVPCTLDFERVVLVRAQWDFEADGLTGHSYVDLGDDSLILVEAPFDALNAAWQAYRTTQDLAHLVRRT